MTTQTLALDISSVKSQIANAIQLHPKASSAQAAVAGFQGKQLREAALVFPKGGSGGASRQGCATQSCSFCPFPLCTGGIHSHFELFFTTCLFNTSSCHIMKDAHRLAPVERQQHASCRDRQVYTQLILPLVLQKTNIISSAFQHRKKKSQLLSQNGLG